MGPRVAFFADCYNDVNGVALTSRRFTQFARDSGRPFLLVRDGAAGRSISTGGFTEIEVACSALHARVERDLAFDLLFPRHLARLTQAVREFRADLIHVTSPGHIGLLGAMVAHRLGLPMAASWHTNIHEYSGRRLDRKLRWCPPTAR